MILCVRTIHMKLPLLLLVGSLFGFGAAAQEPMGWTLVWADEFSLPDGSAPDSRRWAYDTGASGWGNNEWQYYTSRTNNARIENGHLVIEARKESFSGADYTSARLKTQGKASWRYGRIEARIQIPRGQGIWPAFWMLGTNITSVGWPKCGEIDVLENIGREPTTVHGTVHGPGYSGGDGIGGAFSLSNNAAFADDFHVYAVEWTTNSIQWFVDGQQYFSLTPASLPSGAAWVFAEPQFLILNVAVGGNWPGNPDATTEFPQRMLVDYVRVYSPTPLGTSTTNALTNPGFESGTLSGWSTYGDGFNTLRQAIHAGPVRSGDVSFKVFGRFNGAENYSGVYQDLPSLPGEVYRAEAWALTPLFDRIAGGNTAWVEVTFRDVASAVLAIYRTRTLDSGAPPGAWLRLPVAVRVNPTTFEELGTVTNLIAPANTSFLRYQVVFRQPATAAGSVSFDDLQLILNPRDHEPVPSTSIWADNALRMSFRSFLGVTYRVQWRASLDKDDWTTLHQFDGSGLIRSVELETGDESGFFRVIRTLND